MNTVFYLQGREIVIDAVSSRFARRAREMDLSYSSRESARMRIREALNELYREVGTVERLEQCSTRTRNYLMTVLALSYDVGVKTYPE